MPSSESSSEPLNYARRFRRSVNWPAIFCPVATIIGLPLVSIAYIGYVQFNSTFPRGPHPLMLAFFAPPFVAAFILSIWAISNVRRGYSSMLTLWWVILGWASPLAFILWLFVL
jgi:hypothetical protein